MSATSGTPEWAELTALRAGWYASCQTCGESQITDPDWEDDVPLTEMDAHQWQDDHRCEPFTHIHRPAEAP